MSKTYTIIGRVFTKKHGYLASFTRCDYIANNDKDAIKQAKNDINMQTCNDFEIEEIYNNADAEQLTTGG